MSYFGEHYLLYVPPSISGNEKVKMSTTNQITMTETEQLTKGIVIFGATGDLCKKKLIPSITQTVGERSSPTQLFNYWMF